MSFKSLIGLVVSLVLVIALIFSVSWHEVWGALKQMQFWPLIPATVLFLVQYLIRSMRWRLLLPEGTQVKNKALFDSMMVGNLANFVLPLRAGEFIRPFLLTRYTQISFPICLVSVIVERFFDLALVLGLFGIVTFITPGIPTEVTIGASALGTVAIGILVIIILGSFMEDKLLSAFDFLSKPLPIKVRTPLRKFSKDFLDGASVLKTPARVLNVIFMTVVIWFLIIALNWIFFALFELNPSVEAVLALTVITALAVAAPSAPGFIGVFQWACIAAFALFEYPNEKAVAFSIITHIYNFILFILFGGFVLWRDGLKLADLKPSKSSDSSFNISN